MFDRRRVAVAALLIAVAAGSWWIARRSGEPEPVVRTATESADYVIERFTALGHDTSGRVTHRLTADKLTHYPHDDHSDLVNPYLIQYFPGRAAVHTRADTGLLTDGNTRLLMKGEVRSARGRDPGGPGGEILAGSMLIKLDRAERKGQAQGLP